MKNIVIVSTYPENGSRNIGDQLITNSLAEIIKQHCDAKITTVWRADNWDNVSEPILNADHVFFACLAVRKRMETNIYPYLNNIIDSGVPFSVIAAGTDLPVHRIGGLYSGLSRDTLHLLGRVNNCAKVFTTRGALTQGFCVHAGLDQAKLSGDVAFYDRRFDGLVFTKNREIKKVVISDPHRPALYLSALKVLQKGISELFPSAKITLAQHGVSDCIDEFCSSNDLDCAKIYKDRDGGLNIYDDADLHVGFRVHGHVSALKRRKYSYLLEQDGRGCDYGLTLDRKISIPNYAHSIAALSLKNLARLALRRPLAGGTVSTAPAQQLIALIKKDGNEGFRKFEGLESQLGRFNEHTVHSVIKALSP